ncbi:uncharacterized protein ARMOST_16644 [Armillaria ostoyae]|uniref:Uncharacterized protein n=1 Tax=Armillaria ostoyae TaxID=47428 RepID=A0A284RWS9_ARMOS|nr:uncharacterized protein ARMOST_16644 [Armillaria ostoyae]
MPNGKVTNVAASTDPDLFFSPKGRGNNFSVVTQFTLKRVTSGSGGTTVYATTVISTFTARPAAKFSSEVTDLKAAILIVFGYAVYQIVLATIMVYDGPALLVVFLNMTSLRLDVKERSFVDLIKSTRLSVMSTAGSRAVFNDIPMFNYSESTIKRILDDLTYAGDSTFFI